MQRRISTQMVILSVPSPGVLLAVVSLAAGLLFYKRRQACLRVNPQSLPYPPGPPPCLLVGNLFDLARENEVEAYVALAKKYGSVCFFTIAVNGG